MPTNYPPKTRTFAERSANGLHKARKVSKVSKDGVGC